MAPSDIREKNRNIAAQLQSILYTTSQKYFGKFTSCRTFGAHKLLHSEPFLDYLHELRDLLSTLGSDVRNFFIYLHIFPPPKQQRWNFLQISQLSIRSGAHKLFRRIFGFSQFLTAISRKLWRHLATNVRTM